MDLGLSGKRVAILATDGVEQVELLQPRDALEAAGARTELLAPKAGEIQAFNHFEKGERLRVDRVLGEARAAEYSALLLPGGVVNSDTLRGEPAAVQFVREMMLADKPVAAICHGAWLLVEADAVAGRTLTSWPTLKTDIKNAGGTWVDEPVHVDDRLVTSRKPADIPYFNKLMVTEFGNRLAESQLDQLSEASFPASDPPPGPGSAAGASASTTASRTSGRSDTDTRP
jgi:protease I